MTTKHFKIISSKIAPNPKEVKYWADLTADKYGKVIKVYDGKNWIAIASSGLDSSNISYSELKDKPSISGVELKGNVMLSSILDASNITTEQLPSEIITEEELDQHLADTVFTKEEVEEYVTDAVSGIEGSNVWIDV